ncbi:MAG TPA: phospholipase A [Marinobacter sp.]|nr:phospholipase A [Marinobacter sp.]
MSTRFYLRNAVLSVVMAVLYSPSTTFADELTGRNSNGDQLTADECALISNGVRRLSCYDHVLKASEARQAADSTEVDRVEKEAIESLPSPDDQEQRIADNANAGNSVVDEHMAAERAIFSFSGSFVTYRPMYILPVSWVKHTNPVPVSPRLGESHYDYDMRHEEAKYQISFKVPLLTGFFDQSATLWFGYTQRSFWQVYNRDESAPFRETNYEPEIFLRYQTDWKIGPGKLNNVTVGINHQSNGQPEPQSRSWNRIVGTATYGYNRWMFMIQPWYRIPESSKDDNADITKYLGYASYLAVYKLGDDRTFSLRMMNNLRSDNKSSVEFGYSFPMGDTVKGFFQYYNGYGESLIDYNHRIERFGIGIMLNNWL